MTDHAPDRKSIAKKTVTAGIAEIDHAELTIRLLEIGIKLKRPEGQSGHTTLEDMKAAAQAGKIPAYIISDFELMAAAAVKYIAECINNMRSVQ